MSYIPRMNEKKASRSGKRARGKTSLTISLPETLKAALEGAAKAERRSVSNYMVLELERKFLNKSPNSENTSEGWSSGSGK